MKVIIFFLALSFLSGCSNLRTSQTKCHLENNQCLCITEVKETKALYIFPFYEKHERYEPKEKCG